MRRGYFVRGLAGAQFAVPEAVELLRNPVSSGDESPAVVMNVTDPANGDLIVEAGKEMLESHVEKIERTGPGSKPATSSATRACRASQSADGKKPSSTRKPSRA